MTLGNVLAKFGLILIGWAINFVVGQVYAQTWGYFDPYGTFNSRFVITRMLGIWAWIPDECVVAMISLSIPFAIRKWLPGAFLYLILGIIAGEILSCYDFIWLDESTSPFAPKFR